MIKITQTYYGKNGELFDINVSGNHFLAKITMLRWDKIGIPRPLSKEDALLISRILKNYVKIQKDTSKDKAHGSYFWSKYGYAQDDDEDIEWVQKVADFFDRCEGLMTEDEWYANNTNDA